MRRFTLLALTLSLPGCDLLFPEFAGSAPDLATALDGGADLAHLGAPDGGTTTLTGVTCTPTDLRDLNTCAAVALAGLRVSVEETGDHADVDTTGHFALALAHPLTVATLRTSDPTGTFAPTVTALTLGPATVALPLYRALDLQLIAMQNGFPIDPTRGILLGYAIDAAGHPLAGVSTTAPPGASGPLYDGPIAGAVELATATRAHGLIALFNLPIATPPTTRLIVTTAATAPVAGDQFLLPLRPAAITFSLLVLPPR